VSATAPPRFSLWLTPLALPFLATSSATGASYDAANGWAGSRSLQATVDEIPQGVDFSSGLYRSAVAYYLLGRPDLSEASITETLRKNASDTSPYWQAYREFVDRFRRYVSAETPKDALSG